MKCVAEASKQLGLTVGGKEYSCVVMTRPCRDWMKAVVSAGVSPEKRKTLG